ncbi:hypothetical protein [Pantoea alhagi]|nr:hypothetical protein [Pantoea alhagi]
MMDLRQLVFRKAGHFHHDGAVDATLFTRFVSTFDKVMIVQAAG